MRRGLVALAVLALATAPVRAADAPALVNGGFLAWTDAGDSHRTPAGWSIDEGAHREKGLVPSVVEPCPDGGIRLRASRETTKWMFVHQRVTVDPKATYRLSFEARISGAPPLGGTSSQAYVGLASGGAVGPGDSVMRIDVPNRGEFTPGEVIVRAAGSSPIDVRMFLPHEGILDVRAVTFERLEPKSSLAVLVRAMDRYYAHFEGHDAEWTAAVTSASGAVDPADETAFVATAKALLAPLRDQHVWIKISDGRLIPTHVSETPPEHDFKAIAKRLLAPKSIARIALAGDAAEGIGYLALVTLSADEAAWAAVGSALEAMLDRKALILDLRTNVGGEERRAQALAAMLCDEPRVYARRRLRNGPGHADFGEPFDAVVRPREGSTFSKPMAVLIGPGCSSSGEGFVQMLAALPHARLFGLPTRGASGSPAPVDLPNGVSVWFSRWVNVLPDGSAFEGRGVPPDVRVEPKPGEDAALDAAIAYLRERTAAPKGGMRIAGTVREPDGTPIAGAAISLTLHAEASDRGLGDISSDAGGRFELSSPVLDALSPGERAVASLRGIATAPLHRPSPPAFKVLPPRSGPPEITWEFVLARGASQAGRVLDAEGRPVASAEVVLCSDPNRNEHESIDVLTDAMGRYALPVTKAGSFSLSARKYGVGAAVLGSPLALDPAHDAPDVDLTLRGEGTIEGKAVYPDGSPAAWLSVEAAPPKAEARTTAGTCAAESLGLTTGRATADAQGRFKIAGLKPGGYVVRERTDFTEIYGLPAQAEVVHATGDRDVVVVCRSRRLLLRAVDEAGKPVQGARYHLHGVGPHLDATAEGIFSRADGVDPVDVEADMKVTVSAFGTDLRSDEASFVIEAARWETTVTLMLKRERTPAGRLRVAVAGPDGKPIAAYRVEAEPVFMGAGSYSIEEFGPEAGGQSPPLKPGKYDVTVRPGHAGPGAEPAFYVAEEFRVEVKDGEITPVVVSARLGGRLRVTFRERGARIPENATVGLHSAATGQNHNLWPYSFVGPDWSPAHLPKFLPDVPHSTNDAIVPGRWTVRLAMQGIRTFETLVEIEAGKTADVELLVQPD